MENARSFQQQAFKILDPSRTKTVFNGEWFEVMNFEQIIRLNSRVTLQQMLHREDFRARIERGDSVRLHEIQYPIIQGWDSVMVKADVEMGGTDQLFNILVGRDLQREEGMAEQVVLLMPLLEGLDGVQKMSKSLNNYVGVTEAPTEMFGKLMSISDALMARYYLLLLGEDLPAIHPMEAKKELARRIVARYHSEAEAEAALVEFSTRFSKRDLDSADLPVVPVAALGVDLLSAVVASYSTAFQITKSRGEARRLVEQGSVQWRAEKVTDSKATPAFAPGDVLRLDKTRAVRLG
jgi:tyrosyl-tRNA synthetase